jgi:hypothetical protein
VGLTISKILAVVVKHSSLLSTTARRDKERHFSSTLQSFYIFRGMVDDISTREAFGCRILALYQGTTLVGLQRLKEDWASAAAYSYRAKRKPRG